MTKHELLKSVGFSEEYLDHLRKVEQSDNYVFEAQTGVFQQQTCDVTNFVVGESVNNFSTWLVTKKM